MWENIMSFEKKLKNKLNKAYQIFKKTVSTDEHDAFMTLLEKVHNEAHDIIVKGDGELEGSEFSHALSFLSESDAEVKDLLELAKEFPTVVKSNGELLGVGKWELLDPGWIEALEQLFLHFKHKAPFVTNPVTLPISDNVNFVIAGDWGTGNWRDKAPSELVGEQMAKLKADYSIHLGDVYYAGTKEQEINSLVEHWPAGSKGSFTLNSNHEMYNGAFSYFEQALTHKFKEQKGCSYFALENKEWLIIGLDTAYHANPFDLFLKGNLGEDQINWLKTLPKNKRIIVLSHHEGYDIQGVNKGPVYNQLVNALGREPNFWYWGHLHNAIVYKPKGGFYGRCVGHGAIPYGDARILKHSANVAWYEDKSANDPDIPVRVLNGFVHINLDGNKLSEKLIDENGNERVVNNSI